MDRLTEITLKAGQVGGITDAERDEWHRLHLAPLPPYPSTHAIMVEQMQKSGMLKPGETFPVWPELNNVRPLRPLSYLDHQAADRYLDAQRKP